MKKEISDNCLSLTNYFLNDTSEYLRRYCLCLNSVELFEKKSWGVKSFTDLRLAYETILKAIIIYYSFRKMNNEEILNKIMKYGHDLKKLENKILKINNAPKSIKKYIQNADKKLLMLPVGLRYSYDVYDFMWAEEKLFYETLRRSSWLNRLHKLIQLLHSTLESKIQKLPIEYHIVSGSQIDIKKLFKPEYSKYASKIKKKAHQLK